jgi:hypothetical protein
MAILKASEIAVVLVGDFNPRIFLPQWFVAHQLIEAKHVNGESLDVAHPDICQFRSDWCTLNVNKHRFQASSSFAPLVRTVDLVSKTFGEYLVHTPITQFAVNHINYYDLGNADTTNKLGQALAPAAPWGPWGETFDDTDISKRGGLLKIEMIQKNVEDRESGHVKTTVWPTDRGGPFGVGVMVNDHINLTGERKTASVGARMLHEMYEQSERRAQAIFETFTNLASDGIK